MLSLSSSCSSSSSYSSFADAAPLPPPIVCNLAPPLVNILFSVLLSPLAITTIPLLANNPHIFLSFLLSPPLPL